MRFSRFLPVILLLVISVPLLAFSVSADTVTGAVPVNYNDYVTDVTVDGDNDLVTVAFPTSWFTVRIADVNWNTLAEFDGPSGSYSIGSTNSVLFVLAPFGDASRLLGAGAFNGRYLSFDNIPADASFRIDFSVNLERGSPSIYLSRYSSLYVRDDVVVHSALANVDANPSLTGTGIDCYFNFEGSFERGYEGWFPVFNLGLNGAAGNISYSCDFFGMDMSINSYYRMLDSLGYGEALDDLKQELAEQNKKLDDFLEYEPDNSPPPEQEQLDKVEDAENQLMGSVNDGFNEAYDLFDSVSIFFGSLQPALLAVASILGEFIGLDTSGVPGFYVLISISMALGVLGVLLSIGTQLSKSSWSYEGKYTRGKGGHK